MSSELHLFIIWEKAFAEKTGILQDMNDHGFHVQQVYNMIWNEDSFSRNLTRFYGENLPNNSEKERHCGNGPFTLVIVEDPNPVYENRKTSRGWEKVNVNTFDAKSRFRERTGGGHRIHGTNSPKETAHDLMLLLGDSYDDYVCRVQKPWNGDEITLQRDLTGNEGWRNIQELFLTLNETVSYVVLRNFECLPDQYHMEEHGDIDILTENAAAIAYICNATKVFPEKYRVHYDVPIGGEMVKFDFRFCGDQYYDQKWQTKILENRVLHKDIFYVPALSDYYYSMLYHSAVHKREIHHDYKFRLQKLAEEAGFSTVGFSEDNFIKRNLNDFMSRSGYKYTEPKDLSVYFNRYYTGNVYISLTRKYRETKSDIENYFRKMINTNCNG